MLMEGVSKQIHQREQKKYRCCVGNNFLDVGGGIQLVAGVGAFPGEFREVGEGQRERLRVDNVPMERVDLFKFKIQSNGLNCF